MDIPQVDFQNYDEVAKVLGVNLGDIGLVVYICTDKRTGTVMGSSTVSREDVVRKTLSYMERYGSLTPAQQAKITEIIEGGK